MIKAVITNEILNMILEIEKNRYKASSTPISLNLANRLRKNSKKKSSYASNKIEGNPLSESQAFDVIEADSHRHLLKPEQEIRNYYLALNYLDECVKAQKTFSKELILNVRKLVENGASKEKIGLRGQMPPGVLFAVYDSETGNPDYIPPKHSDVPALLDELVEYVNKTDDHPLLVAAIVHYQLVSIHPFEDGNGRTARLMSGYIMDLNGFGFNGIGSLEEYFAYDVDEYYKSIQMGLPALYYIGRNDPPHPEIWFSYFLRMVGLYSKKVCDVKEDGSQESLRNSISHLNTKEISLLIHLIEAKKSEFTPIEISKKLSMSNRTAINRLMSLAKCGLVEPILVKQRVRSYKLTDLAKSNKAKILKIKTE